MGRNIEGNRSGCVKKKNKQQQQKKDSIHMLISFPELHSRRGFKLMSVCACSVMSDLLQFFEITRLLCPWNFPGKTTRVGCGFLLQGIFLIQGLNPCLLYLLHRKAGSLSLCYLGIPELMKVLSKRAFQIHDVPTLFHTLFR